MGFRENLATLQPVDAITRIEIYGEGEVVGSILNKKGQRGSLQVYANILGFNDGQITPEMVKRGIWLFSEYALEARRDSSSHPNIQRLFEVQDGAQFRAKIVYDPHVIEKDIAVIGDMKGDGISLMNNPFVRRSVKGLVSLLENGTVRAVEKDGEGNWNANTWVKQGILYGFGGCGVVPMEHGGEVFNDKALFPPQDPSMIENVRIVPGGTSVRGGAYLAPGVVVMPPTYANVGAFVDEGTMLDSFSLVGSCAQVGRKCHISAGAKVGGVLEPIGADPCVVEDGAFMGMGTSIAEGTVLGEHSALASGVHLTSSIRVYDRTTDTIIEKVNGKTIIPERAIVVGGSRDIGKGYSLNAAIIVKYGDESTDAKTALEEALRE